jgi:tRNA-N(6)-(isopentenyl)adenosine-37 thiotransferase enzyme MiaB/tRNA dimethylallyltransferase
MKYYLKAFGCQMNVSDSERIASFLEQQHYQFTNNMESADLIVVVACSVRQSAIDRVFGLNKKFKKIKLQNPNIKFILTGCVLKQDKPKFKNMFDEILSIQDFFKYPFFRDRRKVDTDYLELISKHSLLKSAYVPIMTGCNNFCTYCVVPYTRGREISRPANNIIREIKGLIKNGYGEIVLLGQNVNSYNSQATRYKKQTNYKSQTIKFPNLLKMITDIHGDFIIKFLTSHPKDFSDELINVIANSPKFSKEIHLPVQSGDNKILEKMNRKYTHEHYIGLIKKIKNKIPEAKFTTDVIVGFPGETKKQFENTVKLFKEVNFDLAYINKYSTRQGTVAASFEDNIKWNEKVKRWNILNEIANSPQSKTGPTRADKLIVVLGPTASGKSDLAVQIAKKFDGEIVSADSRQVYRGMDIGTGKITPDTKNSSNFSTGQAKKENIVTHKGISHYMIDVANPKKQFSVGEHKRKAEKIIQQIIKNKKIPIICGGTGFYIQAITENLDIPEVAPDWKLRNELEKKTTEKLFEQLKKLDPGRAENIDKKNRRRLIRAIEIVLKTGKPIPQIIRQLAENSQYNVLYLGIKKSVPELKKLIHKRLIKRINAGMIEEIKKLHQKGVTWKRLDDFGLEYRYVARYLQGILTKQQMIKQLEQQIINFSKRQMTWFNKYPGKQVHWIKNYSEAKKLIKSFLLPSHPL